MHAEARRFGCLLEIEADLGEDLLAGAPSRGEALEGRAVVEAGIGQLVIGGIQRERIASRRRPLVEVLPGFPRLAGDDAFAVTNPAGALVLAGFGPRVNRNPSLAALAGGVDRDPQRHATGLGQDQRHLQRQLLEQAAADLARSPQRQLDESGAGENHLAGTGVIGQPGMGLQRDAARESHAVLLGILDRGAEKGVLGLVEANRAGIGAAAEPESQ